MQTLFTWLLMIVLAGSVLSLLAMGLGLFRRANRLAQQAHQDLMSFATSDPFDIPARYRNLALIHSGHSAHAHNVTYGRLGGWPVRACDFRFEAGHGTRRLSRHYSLALAETDMNLGEVLMWHDQDQDNAPLALRQGVTQQGPWQCVGDLPLAARLAADWPDLPGRPISLQVLGHVLMLCCPVARGRDDYHALLDVLARVLACLNRQAAPRPEPIGLSQ